jgi:hypothetical protein
MYANALFTRQLHIVSRQLGQAARPLADLLPMAPTKRFLGRGTKAARD